MVRGRAPDRRAGGGGTIPAGAGPRRGRRGGRPGVGPSRGRGAEPPPSWSGPPDRGPSRRGAETSYTVNARTADRPSPRARGRGRGGRGDGDGVGTIPAGAGPSRYSTVAADRCTDHPRGRGAEAAVLVGDLVDGGPSPRARGRGRAPGGAVQHRGTIPAGAGPSGHRAGAARQKGDHPRGRGAEACAEVRRTMAQGPSPRARGRAR